MRSYTGIFTLPTASFIAAIFIALASNSNAAVLFTEIMYDPAASDFDFEYVEIYNNGNSAIDLNGWELRDSGTTERIIANSSLLLQPEVFFVIGDISLAQFNDHWNISLTSANYVEMVDSFPALNNGGDAVQLLDGSDTVISSVDYSLASFPSAVDESLIFDANPNNANAVQNQDGNNWITASSADLNYESDGGGIGSPGNVVPEPSTMVLLGGGLASIAFVRRRRSRQIGA